MPYEAHLSCTQPPSDEVPVWRFLSLSKFLDLIDSHTLHFSRLDQFEDRYEGVAFGAHLAQIRLDLDEKSNRLYDEMRRDTRVRFYVNSWHLAEHEPASMWKQYASSDAGIAICTTFGELRRALDCSKERIFLGLVRYAAPSVFGPLQPFDFVMAKRASFEHEKEVRAFIWRDVADGSIQIEEVVKTSPPGIKVNVILQNFLEEVVVSPAAPDWLPKVLEGVMEKYGIDTVLVRRSNLYDEPDPGAS